MEAFPDPPCSVGVPPASSPSVSLDEVPGGETPPELAAGTAALRHAGSVRDARRILKVATAPTITRVLEPGKYIAEGQPLPYFTGQSKLFSLPPIKAFPGRQSACLD